MLSAIYMTFRLRPTLVNAAMASDMCSGVWLAIIETRIIARPCGTAGCTIGLAKTPSCSSRPAIR